MAGRAQISNQVVPVSTSAGAEGAAVDTGPEGGVLEASVEELPAVEAAAEAQTV